MVDGKRRDFRERDREIEIDRERERERERETETARRGVGRKSIDHNIKMDRENFKLALFLFFTTELSL